MKINILLFIVIFILAVSVIYNPCQKAYAESLMPVEYEIAAQSQNLTLYCNMETGAIMVRDMGNEYLWQSVVDDSLYDMQDLNNQFKKEVTSMIAINHVKMVRNLLKWDSSYSSDSENRVRVDRIANGVSMEYVFTSAKINVSLEIVLEGDQLVVRIPAEKIIENGESKLVNIELMPYFGAADKTVDGYMFYPDGCGAITRYGNVDMRGQNVKEYVWDIYSPEEVNIDNYMEMQYLQKYNPQLPVFGIKNSDNAILSAITKGDYDAKIRLSPEGAAINLNRIHFEFVYRHTYSTKMSDITVYGTSVSKNPEVKRIDLDLNKKDREVRIFFLNGSDANYSGMANKYREFLLNNNLMKKLIQKDESIPLSIDLFMGVTEERMLFDKYISMTTFKQAEKITGSFLEQGVHNLDVGLKGWTAGGIRQYPVIWPPERKIGGKKGLRNFLEYASKENIQVFLENNFTYADKDNGGFSSRADVVHQGSLVPVSDYSETFFILNPFSTFKRFSQFINNLFDYGSTGVAIQNIGEMIYHDYNRENEVGREGTAKTWNEMLETAQGSQRKTAVEGGNLYLLKNADRLYGIPINSSKYFITDEVVPFYQMVVHGSIPYTSEPGNLSYDLNKTVLKWVEFGCVPYFELTWQEAVKLKNTTYNHLFTSCYKDWKDEAVAIYNEFNTRLSPVWGQFITGHKRLSEGFYHTEYEDGTNIYINYNKEDIQYEGYTVKAQDYLVIENGGALR